MLRPYVGVTGFTLGFEVETALKEVPHGADRSLMIGVLVSDKTLRGEQNKYPRLYPGIQHPNALEKLFLAHPAAFNVIHYNTSNPEALRPQLVAVVNTGGPNLHGIQLNMWTEVADLEWFRKRYPTISVIQQVGGMVQHACHHKPRAIAEWIRERRDFIDYVLLDSSDGTGLNLNVAYMEEMIGRIIQKVLGKMPLIGVAGGLREETLRNIEPLLRLYVELSYDAQGKLRDEKSGGGDLVVPRMKAYLREGFALPKRVLKRQ